MDKHYNYCCRYSLNNKSISGRLCGSNRKWLLRDVRNIIRSETFDGNISAFEVTDKDWRVIDRCTYFPKTGLGTLSKVTSNTFLELFSAVLSALKR